MNPRAAMAFAAVLVLTLAPNMSAADVKLVQKDAAIDVAIDGQPFTTYRFLATPEDKAFHRPYCYPVHAADGKEVTSDQIITNPKEHPHHRSVWVSHGDVNGVDHWSHKGAKQKHIKFERLEGDTIVEQLEWSGKTESDPAILKETRTLRFFALDDGARGIDLTVALTPAGDQPVTLKDTKEAGLCAVRAHSQIGDNKKKAKLANSEGKTGEKDIWGKPAEWCDVYGQIDGKPYGIAIFDHPSNPRHPTTWHTREYGLHAANCWGLHDFDTTKKTPPGTGDMKLDPDKPTTFRYRILFHTGEPQAEKLNALYKDWASK
jgi:hypothetical protein